MRTLKRPEFRGFLPHPRERQRLPDILSKEEVARLINASGNLFRRTLLMVLYGNVDPSRFDRFNVLKTIGTDGAVRVSLKEGSSGAVITPGVF